LKLIKSLLCTWFWRWWYYSISQAIWKMRGPGRQTLF